MIRPPTNVQAHYTDGTDIPIKLVYTGLDEAGIHHWRITTTVNFMRGGTTISCDELPAHTAIDLQPFT